MKFGIKDVFDCLEIAFDIKKVLYGLVLFIIGAAGLFACIMAGSATNNAILYVVFEVIGLIIAYIAYLYAAGGLSAMAYKELTSGEKISAGQAVSLCTKNLSTLVLTPVIVIAIAAALLGIEYLAFMLGKIEILQVILSLLTVPVIILNILVFLTLALGYVVFFAIVASDECGPIAAAQKVLTIARNSALQISMGAALVVVIGIPVALIGYSALFTSVVATLTMFGTASGIFVSMAATEVPTLSVNTQIAWGLFGIFTSVLAGMLGSFIIVYLKTSAVSIYLNIKDRVK